MIWISSSCEEERAALRNEIEKHSFFSSTTFEAVFFFFFGHPSPPDSHVSCSLVRALPAHSDPEDDSKNISNLLTHKTQTKNALSRPQTSAIGKVSAAAANGDGNDGNDDDDGSSANAGGGGDNTNVPSLDALAASPSWRLRAELRWRKLPVPDSDDVPTSELARRLVEGLETRAAEEGGVGSGGGERFFVDPSSPPSEAVCGAMTPVELKSALRAYGARYPKAKADALAALRAAMDSRGWPPPTPAEAAAEAAAKAKAKKANSSKSPVASLSVAQIRDKLTELRVSFARTAKKAALVPLLEEALANSQRGGSTSSNGS